MPGLRVHRSNRIEALSSILIQLLGRPGALPSDPMKAIQIVVGSRGQERWLRHRIATDLGICAQVEFPFPEAFLGALLDDILGEKDRTTRAVWGQGALALSILEHLETSRPSKGPLASLVAPPGSPVTAKQLSVAEQIAQVFDRYGLYRPALVRAWSGLPEPDPPHIPEHLAWQAQLWQGLTEQLDPKAHFAARVSRASERLRSGEVSLAGPIRVFGFAALPPAWLELLGEVARVVEVELFALCPSIEGWDQIHAQADQANRLRHLDRELELPNQLDLSSIHPLHLSLGRSARDTQIVLESMESTQLVIAVDETLQTGPETSSALHRLQADILHCRQPGASGGPAPLSSSDRSIQFHACHGPARQVEVIRDVILGLLDDHRDLEPRDIVIMTPDIATYAPLIEGSFGQGDWYRSGKAHPWGETGAPRLQVEIADLSVRRTNPVADALLRVLAAAADRLTASAALELIALEPVAARHGLGPEDAGRLREIVVQCGIRWGLDDADRERAGQTRDDQNTFAFGLDRLALGVAMADEGTAIELTPDGETAIAPWDPAEQADTLALLGRFFDFCETIGEVVSGLREPRPLADWVSHLTDVGTGVLDRLTRTEGVSQWLTQRVRAELLDLSLEAEAAQSTRPLRLDAIQALLDGRFEVASGITRQQTGAITCCALRPMRSVPYRVVCLIGMDEGRFPSQGTLPGFDWTALAPRAGDKVPRDEDQLMLLEAILSARSHLAVAYTGRSVRTNQPCQPCVPIAELREIIDQTFSASDLAASAFLTTAHALHNFSPVNFRSDPGPPRSFDHRVMAAAEAGLGPRSDPAFLPTDQSIHHVLRDPDTVIELQTLTDFFSNPARALLKQRFGLRLQSYTTELEDQVPVELSGRDQRRIDRDLLQRTLEHMRMLGQDLTEQTAISDWLRPVVAHMRATGTLPPGPASGHVLAPQLEVLEHLCLECADLMMSPEHTEQVRIPLTVQGRTVELIGQVPHLPGGAMVIFVPRADSTSGAMWWLLGPWIQLLAWMAHAPEKRRRLGVVHAYQGDGPKLQYRVFGPDWPVEEQQERARALLQWMVQAYQAGMDRPLALYPQTSFQFAWGIHSLNSALQDSAPIVPESFESDDTAPNPAALAGPMKLARKAWGSTDSRSGDARDVHIVHLYGNTRPFLQSESARPLIPDPVFAANALRLWLPLITSRQKVTAGKKGIAPFLDALEATVEP